LTFRFLSVTMIVRPCIFTVTIPFLDRNSNQKGSARNSEVTLQEERET